MPLLIEAKREVGTQTDLETCLPDGKTIRSIRESAKHKGYFTPEEWRSLQPYIVNLSFPTSRKIKEFLRASDSELVFKTDDPDRGLRFLKCGSLYNDGLFGAGLNLSPNALVALDSIL